MRLGLRAKSALALLGCVTIVLSLALLAGWQGLRSVQQNLGVAFARNVTQYNKQRILTPVLRELVLSQRLADSEVTRRWLNDETSPAKKSLFFTEAEGYRRAFTDHSYFVASARTGDYYFNDNHGKWSDQPRNILSRSRAADAWFFSTLKNTRLFNLNVDHNATLGLTKIWINVLVRDHDKTIGVVGSGLDLTTFLNEFINNSAAGVTPIIVNRKGSIQAYRDRGKIEYSAVNGAAPARTSIDELLDPADREALRRVLLSTQNGSGSIRLLHAQLNGKPQIIAVSYIPELEWNVVTAVDLTAARVLNTRLWLPLAGSLVGLLLCLLIGITLAVNRMLLSPLLRLTGAVRAMTAGDYAIELPATSSDEMGELTRSFGMMAAQVRSHTDDLEARVHERTRELKSVNVKMADANKKLGDSIEYASLIQNAILASHDMQRELGPRHFLIWRPRDRVGGDFYLFRRSEHGYLIGICDCAGHGVPGAFMTMIAYSALTVAMDGIGIRDPAALLREVDARMRSMFGANPDHSQVATHMDAALAFVDPASQVITYSGAKISLYSCRSGDGGTVREHKGASRPIGGRHIPMLANETIPLKPGQTFYFTTDGLLDQAGGRKGYGFGSTRFRLLLQRCAGAPCIDQRTVFDEAIANHQESFPQRDDITIIGFCPQDG